MPCRYFNGKNRAEEAIAKYFPSTGVLIKPTFIYGGESFGLTPPRVSDGYGSGIDALLSSGPIRAIAGVSPGLIKVCLRQIDAAVRGRLAEILVRATLRIVLPSWVRWLILGQEM